MAFLSINNIKVVGLSASVPKPVSIHDLVVSDEYDSSDFSKFTGIEYVRVSNEFTASDLCFEAAEKLIEDLNWDKKEIGAIVFISQHRDYILPATSCILQERMQLDKSTMAFDISMGCSGWVYGLSVLASLMSHGSISKALLMVGDAKKIAPTEFDPLFGYAGTVTALEFDENFKSPMVFDFGTDGSGYDAIIIPDGGSRNQMSPSSFELENIEGRKIHRLQSRMKGMDVFSFAISTAPRSIKNIIANYNMKIEDIDYFILHQANMMINDKIRSKLKLDEDKFPSTLNGFGNTSSGSIPLTIVAELKNKIESKPTKLVCCGFGVGLSWGTVLFDTDNIIISDLIEM